MADRYGSLWVLTFVMSAGYLVLTPAFAPREQDFFPDALQSLDCDSSFRALAAHRELVDGAKRNQLSDYQAQTAAKKRPDPVRFYAGKSGDRANPSKSLVASRLQELSRRFQNDPNSVRMISVGGDTNVLQTLWMVGDIPGLATSDQWKGFVEFCTKSASTTRQEVFDAGIEPSDRVNKQPSAYFDAINSLTSSWGYIRVPIDHRFPSALTSAAPDAVWGGLSRFGSTQPDDPAGSVQVELFFSVGAPDWVPSLVLMASDIPQKAEAKPPEEKTK